jgi:prevent-host-death family protein
MATEVPQRALRNETAALLKRVQGGERLRVTVHGHPVAEIRPLPSAATLVPTEMLRAGLRGLLDHEDPLREDLLEVDQGVRDPFE